MFKRKISTEVTKMMKDMRKENEIVEWMHECLNEGPHEVIEVKVPNHKGGLQLGIGSLRDRLDVKNIAWYQ